MYLGGCANSCVVRLAYWGVDVQVLVAEPLVHDEVEYTADVLHKACDIVSYSSVATNLEHRNDEIHGHTCEDPYTDD